MIMLRRFREIIQKYIPQEASVYCVHLWEKYPFSFKVSRQRTSKIGDYRFNPRTGNHEISVNGNLNPYAFLITYVHEVAHMMHYLKNGNNRPPHGKVWKQIFQDLMQPLMADGIFPEDIHVQLARHMKNPKASSQSDAALVKSLKHFDHHQDDTELYLEELDEGASFVLNRRVYTKIKKRRTRSLCREKRTGRNFLISELAVVKEYPETD